VKLTKQQLKQIIKEELGRVMSEVRFEDMVQASGVGGTADDPNIAGELEAERRREQERREAETAAATLSDDQQYEYEKEIDWMEGLIMSEDYLIEDVKLMLSDDIDDPSLADAIIGQAMANLGGETSYYVREFLGMD
jgi:hypothetical protein